MKVTIGMKVVTVMMKSVMLKNPRKYDPLCRITPKATIYWGCIILYCKLPRTFTKPLRLLGNFNVNALDCSSVLRVACPCCCFFVVFCDSFLCSISLLLLSDSLSYVLNCVL